jgi:hypothetical protein
MIVVVAVGSLQIFVVVIDGKKKKNVFVVGSGQVSASTIL